MVSKDIASRVHIICNTLQYKCTLNGQKYCVVAVGSFKFGINEMVQHVLFKETKAAAGHQFRQIINVKTIGETTSLISLIISLMLPRDQN